MTNKNDVTNLLGYWNGDTINPEISFNQEEALKYNKKLYIITLTPVPEMGAHPLEKTVKDVKRELRNFINTARRLKP